MTRRRTFHEVGALTVRDGVRADTRAVAEETAVAMVYDGVSHAVMMATPTDLEDFAVGFALSEGLIAAPDQLNGTEIVDQPLGIEVRSWLDASASRAWKTRRRRIAGPTGCGLCGVESLQEAVWPLPRISLGRTFSRNDVEAALSALSPAQELHARTGAVHAAGFFDPETALLELREDVGRHNALDKLIGSLSAAGRSPGDGLLALTSRLSVEMVQKAAIAGIGLIVAVSAPTALALRLAEEAGITVVAVARRDGFQIFTHAKRIALGRASRPQSTPAPAHRYATTPRLPASSAVCT